MAAAFRRSGTQARSQLDTGEDVVAPYLWERGMRSVDIVALSHAHEDHIGGLPGAGRPIFIRASCGPGPRPKAPRWRRLRAEAARGGVRVMPMRGPAHFAFGGAQIDVLAPLAGLRAERHAQEQRFAGAAHPLRAADRSC